MKIQLRHDTAANWEHVNPLLLDGEIGVETDTDRGKLGNGSDVWVTLPYMDASLLAEIASVRTSLNPLFNNAERVGDNLVLTRVNGDIVTIACCGGSTGHEPSIKDFAPNIPTRIDVDTDINKVTEIYYNVMNAHNISSLILSISEGQISSISIPSQDGHINTTATISGVDTSTPKNIELQITGDTNETGQTYQSNKYTIQVADVTSVKDVYYGGSSLEAADIDLSTFTKIPYVSVGQEFTFILPVIAGQYYYIFVPSTPSLDKIFNTTFGDTDVTAEFSNPPGGQKLIGVQTIGTVSYDSYRIGPDTTGGEQDLKVRMK